MSGKKIGHLSKMEGDREITIGDVVYFDQGGMKILYEADEPFRESRLVVTHPSFDGILNEVRGGAVKERNSQELIETRPCSNGKLLLISQSPLPDSGVIEFGVHRRREEHTPKQKNNRSFMRSHRHGGKLKGMVAAMLMAAPGAGLAEDSSAFSLQTREELQAEIRSYLVSNPDVLIEVVEQLEKRDAIAKERQDLQLVKAHADVLFNQDTFLKLGNVDGSVKIVEFVDYQCGYCRKAYEEMKRVLAENDDVQIIIKEFPILSAGSELGARAAIAVAHQYGTQVYQKMHDELFQVRGDITQPHIDAIVEKLDLDKAIIKGLMNSEVVSAEIAENMQLARSLSIQGTPALIFERTVNRGYLPYEKMVEIIQQQRVAQPNSELHGKPY